MKKLILVIAFLFLTGCALRENSGDNRVQETENSVSYNQEVGKRYAEKQLAYEEQQRELTFTGQVEDFENVLLTTNNMTIGMPYRYQFIRTGEELEVTVWSVADDTSDEETVYVVEDIQYEDERYSVYAEGQMFEFQTLNESIKRLKDDEGRFYSAERYIPETLSQQWLEEARKEVTDES
ncbi:hypothetical protein [Marinilactibacillus sp. Marseille-P9653]|uniref:hypothetical protein n=1 Tax=Marinilactibacillus sp. Marseille-P9653 TaxID=2866583 RepID=UPI001CE3BC48|nr:hypothetical protein [Marinilactibacillus sp. Marseille-P9653]